MGKASGPKIGPEEVRHISSATTVKSREKGHSPCEVRYPRPCQLGGGYCESNRCRLLAGGAGYNQPTLYMYMVASLTRGQVRDTFNEIWTNSQKCQKTGGPKRIHRVLNQSAIKRESNDTKPTPRVNNIHPIVHANCDTCEL